MCTQLEKSGVLTPEEAMCQIVNEAAFQHVGFVMASDAIW